MTAKRLSRPDSLVGAFFGRQHLERLSGAANRSLRQQKLRATTHLIMA